MSLRSEFRVVLSVTMSAYKRCFVRLYPQLFVGGLKSYCVIFSFAYGDFQHFIISFVFLFFVPCCDVRFDFRIKTVFDSSLPPVVTCRRACVLVTSFLFVCVLWCVFLLCLCSFCVLYTLCCQFRWIVYFFYYPFGIL